MADSTSDLPQDVLQIQVLGELRVETAAGPLPLPASRKTRALLAYLAINPRRHLRSELGGLFWEDAADPRAGLRWSLTQLRHAMGEPHGIALTADRDSVSLKAQCIDTDLSQVARLIKAGIAASASTPRDRLLQATGLFRGELLDGLDMPACYAYHEWCMAEREAASKVHEQILAALIEACRDDPESALAHARTLTGKNPLSETGHVQLMGLLQALGRPREALAQYERCCRIFERELGLGPPPALERARAALSTAMIRSRDRDVVSAPAPAAPVTSSAPVQVPALLVGRQVEMSRWQQTIEAGISGRAADVLLVSGVPGIGKTRLLDEFERQVAAQGGRALRGRAFEAETVRPFGYWIDALRCLQGGELPPPLREPLHRLSQPGSTEALARDRDSLFDAVVDALTHLAQSGPLAVLVDDLHWIEESSAALLHYAIRSVRTSSILFALTGRIGELEDNACAQRLLAALAQSRRLDRLALAPLADDDATALVRQVAPAIDQDQVVAQAQGNPLLLVELCRSQDAGGDDSGLLERILQTRLCRLSQGAGELVQWASALGRRFSLESMIAAQAAEPGPVQRQLSELERHNLIVPIGDAGYQFSHDLFQEAAYSRISQPRRRLMHRSIAVALCREMHTRPETCSEVAHHAGLGGQHELAAKACVLAGEHGLRFFAGREAAEVARRGLRHCAQIAQRATRASMEMPLLRIQVLAASMLQLDRLRPAAAAINHAIDDANISRLHDQVALGYHLLSIVHQETGNPDEAQQATLRAAKSTEKTDALTQARQLANSARCLVELGREIAQARKLVAKAGRLADAAGVQETELRWCLGLLYRWDGQPDLALREFDTAIALADEGEDRWRHCKCLGWAALIELERGRPARAVVRARKLQQLASRLGEEADEPFAQAVEALGLQMREAKGSKPTAPDSVDAVSLAIGRLRIADDKSRLASVFNIAASIQFTRANFRQAGAFASDALATADSIGEVNESLLAHSMLAQVAVALGDRERARLQLDQARRSLPASASGADNNRASAAASDAVTRAERALAGAMIAHQEPADQS